MRTQFSKGLLLLLLVLTSVFMLNSVSAVVNATDPSLVAYWNFSESGGQIAKSYNVANQLNINFTNIVPGKFDNARNYSANYASCKTIGSITGIFKALLTSSTLLTVLPSTAPALAASSCIFLAVCVSILINFVCLVIVCC